MNKDPEPGKAGWSGYPLGTWEFGGAAHEPGSTGLDIL